MPDDNDVVIVPAKLVEMRIWALEQRADIRDNVLLLCDALEDCALHVYEAKRKAKRLSEDVDRVLHALEQLQP